MATVTSEGQVTIPKPVRDLLRIKPGSSVDFERASDGRVVLIKAEAKQQQSRFARLRGHAGKGLTTDAIIGVDARREQMALIDTNLLDLVTDDPRWAEWSIGKLEEWHSRGPSISTTSSTQNYRCAMIGSRTLKKCLRNQR